MAHDGLVTMAALVSRLPAQLRQAASLVEGVDLPDARPRRVLVCGMGGSAAAGSLLAGAFGDGPVDIAVRRRYGLPGHLGEGDLLVFCSYSGGTEETLSAYAEHRERFGQIPSLVLSSGGEISARAEQDGVPRIPLPGGMPPRAALGCSLGALALALERMGALPGAGEALQEAAGLLERRDGSLALGVNQGNPARDLARRLYGRLPVFYSGPGAPAAAAERSRAQLNENAKVLAWCSQLPELDHNEVVGWEAPTPARERIFVVAYRDPGDHPRVARRFAATREVLGGVVPDWVEVEALGSSPLARALSLVQFGDWLSVHLAERNGVDPMSIAAIDKLKARLGNS